MPNRLLALYALPALPLAAIALPFYIIVPSYYATRLGLSLAGIGVVLLLIRVMDAITDPLFGYWSDRITSRFGRRRFFFALSLPLTAVSALMLFWPPSTAGLFYLAFWGAALSIGTTWTTLPHNAWGAELVSDYHGRARLTAWREGATVFGTLVAVSLPFAIGLERADGLSGLAYLGLFVAIGLPVLGLMTVAWVAEPEDLTRRRLALVDGLRQLWDNGPFRRLALAFLLNSFANAVPASLFLFFVSARLGAETLQGPLLFAYFLSAVAGVPLAVLAARRVGKHRAWCISMLAACAIFFTAGFLREGDVAPFVAICILTGLLLGFDLALPPAIQADVIDNDTAMSGEQRSGLYFAAWSLISKLALALSAGTVFPLLGSAGFDANAAESAAPAALWALGALYAWLPIPIKLASIAVMWNFSLDELEQKRLRERIENA